MDRVFKPQLYAQAGIERYLRVELEEQAPVGHLGFLDGETYQQVAHGAVIELDRPFPVTLDLPALDDLDD